MRTYCIYLCLFLVILHQNWRAQGQLVDSLVKLFEAELADTKKQIASVNLERKLQQTAAGKIKIRGGAHGGDE